MDFNNLEFFLTKVIWNVVTCFVKHNCLHLVAAKAHLWLSRNWLQGVQWSSSPFKCLMNVCVTLPKNIFMYKKTPFGCKNQRSSVISAERRTWFLKKFQFEFSLQRNWHWCGFKACSWWRPTHDENLTLVFLMQVIKEKLHLGARSHHASTVGGSNDAEESNSAIDESEKARILLGSTLKRSNGHKKSFFKKKK